jgi:two-component system LytT family response regulator
MPELDGMGVVRTLKKHAMPLIAFVTAYDEHAVRAFEVNAVDYLLKPVEKARLRETLNRAQERIEHAEIVAEQASHVGAALDAYESAVKPPYLERVPVRHRDEVIDGNGVCPERREAGKLRKARDWESSRVAGLRAQVERAES